MAAPDIVALLWKRGLSIGRLSVQHGYARTTLATALRRPYLEAEKIIAAALGLSPQDIWPERFRARHARAMRLSRKGRS
jgi:Ner family transcriptional regulator